MVKAFIDLPKCISFYPALDIWITSPLNAICHLHRTR